jgi:sugar-specific transcriptional regulator TrmB
MNSVLKYLEKLGISTIEGKIYILLLQHGPMTVRELADKVKLNRTALYPYVNSLTNKSVLGTIIHNAQKKLVACEPDRLTYLIEHKFADLESVQAQFPSVLNSLNSYMPEKENENKAEIRYYKGRAGMIKIYEEALMGSDLRIYANLIEVEKALLPKDLNMFDAALKNNKDLKIYEIVADSPESVKKFNLRSTALKGRYFYKFMPISVGLVAACILIYDDNVAIINIKNNSTSFVMHNTDYFINSNKLFDFNWQMIPDIQ